MAAYGSCCSEPSRDAQRAMGWSHTIGPSEFKGAAIDSIENRDEYPSLGHVPQCSSRVKALRDSRTTIAAFGTLEDAFPQRRHEGLQGRGCRASAPTALADRGDNAGFGRLEDAFPLSRHEGPKALSRDIRRSDDTRAAPALRDAPATRDGLVPKGASCTVRPMRDTAWPAKNIAGGARSSAGGQVTLQPGARVRVEGLQRANELNGLVGELTEYDVVSGRWYVQVGGAVKAVRPENLVSITKVSGLPQSEAPRRKSGGRVNPKVSGGAPVLGALAHARRT